MRYVNAICVVLILFLTGCATITPSLSSVEDQYLNEVKNFPLEFYVSKEEVNNAWGRAQSWIARFSDMKIQTVTECVIQTYNPTGDIGGQWGYYVTKTPIEDKFQISVRCIGSNPFLVSNQKLNAHILAYYIKTGILQEKFIAYGFALPSLPRNFWK